MEKREWERTRQIEKEFVNKSLFPVVELELSGRQFEVGDKANKVRISRIGQIWSVEHEQLRFASQILSPTSLPHFTYLGSG